MPENGFWLPCRPKNANWPRRDPGRIDDHRRSPRRPDAASPAKKWCGHGAGSARNRRCGRFVRSPGAAWRIGLGIGRVPVGDDFQVPAPASAMPMAIPVNSSSWARRVGVIAFQGLMADRARGGKSKAPASIACRVMARIWAISSAVAASWRMARSPMTKTRTAACGSKAQTSTSRGPDLQSVKIFGEAFQRQSNPVHDRAGISSTPSINSTSLMRSSARQGEADATIAHHHAGHPMPCRGARCLSQSPDRSGPV